MYLKQVVLKNFRSFCDCTIELQNDLTIFVGENNGGKSNAIDAIRLLTTPLNGRREIYCESTDVQFQSNSENFDLEGHFHELSAGQQGRLISAVTDSSMHKACFGLRFDSSHSGAKPILWAGRMGNIPEPGCRDMIRHVYLPPLRDAKRSLASGNPTRILTLLNHFLEDTTPTQLAEALARTSSHEVLDKIDHAVEKNLTALTSGVRRQNASLGFTTDEALIEIARDLRFKLADHGIHPEDLRYSGHGYANLLFMATIAVELEKVRSADLTLFLVEEPEAHLHPQLQAAVLAFLRDQASYSRKHASIDHGPAGELQVIVATHSPNLSAWVGSDSLVVFKSITPTIALTVADNNTVDSGPSTLAGMTTPILRKSTHCIPLASLPLEALERRKVDRYIDVTKAALLFGGRVFLVEGIAEALLLPVIATHHTLRDFPDKLSLFRSTVFVPIDGVDFAPYIKLLLTPMNGARIAERIVVLTDGDKEIDREMEGEEIDGPENMDNGVGPLIPGERRKATLSKLANELDASTHLITSTSTYSLETELLEAGNSDILRRAFLTLHPQSGAKWDNAVALSSNERAKSIHKIFRSTRKGDFAQVLAQLIEKGSAFIVPEYIAKAINEVVAI